MTKSPKLKVLFAIGDADWKYTRGKFQTLVERVASTDRFQLTVASHDEAICKAFAGGAVKSFCLPGQRMALTPEHTIAMTELMIKHTRDVRLPGSKLDLWKVMAMDDYLGSLDVFSYPALPMEPDIVVCPLMGVDNNTTLASHFYSHLLVQAHQANVSILGLEISPLGNRQTLAACVADFYALKNEHSRNFAITEELAPLERTFVLPPHDNYLLTCRNDSHLDDFFTQEKSLRQRLGIGTSQCVIFIPHNVAFVFEVREMLRSLRRLTFPYSVILRTDPYLARQGLREREIAERAHAEELGALPQVRVDDQGGWFWSLLLADVVFAPAHSVYTELAASYGKFTVICHGWGESKNFAENLCVEPRPQRAADAIAQWVRQNVLPRKGLGEILATVGTERPSELKRQEYGT